MRALRLHRQGPVTTRPLALGVVSYPVPRPGDVLVRVACCGVCRTDLDVVEETSRPAGCPSLPDTSGYADYALARADFAPAGALVPAVLVAEAR